MMKEVVIVDYGLGNLNSVANMVRHVGGKCVISSDIEVIRAAEKLILPGVGAFDRGMSKLNSSGLKEVLDEAVLVRKIPILGICLGMQLMTLSSEEGELKGLGWIDAEVKKFEFLDGQNLKVPHMGWNKVDVKKLNPLMNVEEECENRFYFVHSYFVEAKNPRDIMCTTYYGREFCSALFHENIMGVQFHPEKSHRFGMVLMKQFIKI